jgi:hypothetical protein
MNPLFKVGDKVEVTQSCSFAHLVGKVGEVNLVTDTTVHVKFDRSISYDEYWLNNESVEKVKEKEMKFKVGDRVFINKSAIDKVNIGKKGVVVDLNINGTCPVRVKLDKSDNMFWFYESSVSKIEEVVQFKAGDRVVVNSSCFLNSLLGATGVVVSTITRPESSEPEVQITFDPEVSWPIRTVWFYRKSLDKVVYEPKEKDAKYYHESNVHMAEKIKVLEKEVERRDATISAMSNQIDGQKENVQFYRNAAKKLQEDLDCHSADVTCYSAQVAEIEKKLHMEYERVEYWKRLHKSVYEINRELNEKLVAKSVSYEKMCEIFNVEKESLENAFKKEIGEMKRDIDDFECTVKRQRERIVDLKVIVYELNQEKTELLKERETLISAASACKIKAEDLQENISDMQRAFEDYVYLVEYFRDGKPMGQNGVFWDVIIDTVRSDVLRRNSTKTPNARRIDHIKSLRDTKKYGLLSSKRIIELIWSEVEKQEAEKIIK